MGGTWTRVRRLYVRCSAPEWAGLLVNIEHRLRWWLPTKEQGKGQEEKQEVSRQSGRRSRPGQTEGKSKRRRKEPLEAHGRPGTQLSLWMPPPGLQARPGRPLAAFFVPHNSSFGRLPF